MFITLSILPVPVLVDLIKYVEATERVARRSDVSPFATIRYEIK